MSADVIFCGRLILMFSSPPTEPPSCGGFCRPLASARLVLGTALHSRNDGRRLVVQLAEPFDPVPDAWRQLSLYPQRRLQSFANLS
jgi:hypothetical protein